MPSAGQKPVKADWTSLPPTNTARSSHHGLTKCPRVTLTEARLLKRRKEGLQVFYTIADPTIFKLCELVCGSLEKEHSAMAGVFRRQ